ncbi:MAG TPA: AAA family ATPase [Vicinamibacterales bacterium]|jgi:pilus assembly protein CpaE|nr:AAA family ATPase [Vicinamibacterales bacterium]
MAVQVTIIGAVDRKLEDLVRSSGLRPLIASAMDLLALTKPGAAQPDVLMIDIRAHGQVPATLAALKRQHPATSVLLIARELTPELMLDAMRAGVNECLPEPLAAETVNAALSRLIAQRAVPVGGQVFAFIGAKGGVGTTTLAVNVASALARSRASTLFIDLHPAYGDAAVLLGAEPRFSLLDALDNTHRLDLAFFTSLTTQTSSGVTLLASPENAPAAPVVDAHRIRLLLDFALRNYRYTVLDVPRSNPAMLDALEAAMQIFVVTNQELASVRGANRVGEALGRRYTREKVSVVVSRFDKGADIGAGDIEDVVHVPVKHTFPSDYRLALAALNEGRPFVLESTGRLAEAVMSFTRELTGMPEADGPHPPRSKALLARFGALRWVNG